MGSHGSCSRILTTLYGSPITYATFGEAIAPGQISMDHFLNIYRIPELEEDFFIYGVAGECVIDSESLGKMNNLLTTITEDGLFFYITKTVPKNINLN